MNRINKENEMTNARRRRNRDQFLIILIGLIGYGLILIAIVIGTFFAVKNAFARKDAEVALAVQSQSSSPKVPEEGMAQDEVLETESVHENEGVPEETVFNEHLTDVSEYMQGDGRIDYTRVLFYPGKRDAKLKWSDTVFSKIENVKDPAKAVVNGYVMKRKQAYLTDDKLLELFIYMNPETSGIEKITSIEHGDELKIIDYYYDKGNINYAAERTAVIDVPVDISSGRITSRYYFRNDTLVKYSYCEDNKATVFSVSALGEYSQGTVEQYEFLESDMINKAYITYNAAKTLNEEQLIAGYVLDEYDQMLVDVEVKLYSADDMAEVSRTTTDGDGFYTMSIPVNDDKEYVLSAWKNDFDEVKVYGITARSGSGTYFVPAPRLTYAADGAEYNEQIVVRDSLDNNLPIADASIRLRAGINCREGDVVASSVLDATGAAMFTLQAGNYTAEVSKGGYENSFFNVLIAMGKTATVGFAVKDISEDNLQVILAWDTTPLDLDSRLIGVGAAEILRPSQDSAGALMTETIELPSVSGDNYRYYVSDYSDCTGGDANSGNMTSSGARVYVYSNEGLVALYNVPMGHLGVVWEPLMIRNGRVLPVNNYYNVIEPDTYWTAK